MPTNANPVRQMRRWDCAINDPQIQGACVTIDGVERHFGMEHVRALQQFKPHRDEANNPLRPIGALTEAQLKYFESFGIAFEPAELAGWYHPKTSIVIGPYYRQGY